MQSLFDNSVEVSKAEEAPNAINAAGNRMAVVRDPRDWRDISLFVALAHEGS